jgi:hypothetical protein
MAAAFGVSTSIVSDWKLRKAQMQVDEMHEVSKVTGIPFQDIAEAVREDMDAILEHHEARRSAQRPPRGSVGGRH